MSFQAAFRTVLERYEVGPVDAISLPSAALTGQRNIWDNRVPRAVPWAGEFLRLWRNPTACSAHYDASAPWLDEFLRLGADTFHFSRYRGR